MAIDNKFSSILQEIKLSNLNFAMKITPYAAYITLKKSTVVDMKGTPSQPSLPLFLLLQQTYRDNLIAQEEISRLKNIIKEDKIKYEELGKINLSLSSKLEVADANLVV